MKSYNAEAAKSPMVEKLRNLRNWRVEEKRGSRPPGLKYCGKKKQTCLEIDPSTVRALFRCCNIKDRRAPSDEQRNQVAAEYCNEGNDRVQDQVTKEGPHQG